MKKREKQRTHVTQSPTYASHFKQWLKLYEKWKENDKHKWRKENNNKRLYRVHKMCTERLKAWLNGCGCFEQSLLTSLGCVFDGMFIVERNFKFFSEVSKIEKRNKFYSEEMKQKSWINLILNTEIFFTLLHSPHIWIN